MFTFWQVQKELRNSRWQAKHSFLKSNRIFSFPFMLFEGLIKRLVGQFASCPPTFVTCEPCARGCMISSLYPKRAHILSTVSISLFLRIESFYRWGFQQTSAKMKNVKDVRRWTTKRWSTKTLILRVGDPPSLSLSLLTCIFMEELN